MNSFEDLEAWKKARSFKNNISVLVKSFPKDEKYRLVDQIVRSSRSVSANIAEGFGRFHYQENIQFCRQARGSLNETLNHLIDAFDESYIDQNTLDEFRSQFHECLKVLNGYIAYLKKAKKSDT
jgi:four helix bundle protein